MDLTTEHFRNLSQNAVEEFDINCKTWEGICTDETIPEDVLGEIRTVIGLARLLKSQKLKQFCGLIDDAEFKTGEKEITLVDLQGFWDMVYCEVEKIQKSFKKLETCKKNDWKFVEESAKKIQPKKVVKSVPPKKEGKDNAHTEAAKQRLAEIKKKMKAQKDNASEKASNLLVMATKNSDDGDQGNTKNNVELELPSPSKIAKKQSSKELAENKPARKNARSKGSSKSKVEKNSAAQRKISETNQNKENTPHIEGAKTSKGSRDILEEKMFVAEKRITRSAKKAMLAELEETQKS